MPYRPAFVNWILYRDKSVQSLYAAIVPLTRFMSSHNWLDVTVIVFTLTVPDHFARYWLDMTFCYWTLCDCHFTVFVFNNRNRKWSHVDFVFNNRD